MLPPFCPIYFFLFPSDQQKVYMHHSDVRKSRFFTPTNFSCFTLVEESKICRKISIFIQRLNQKTAKFFFFSKKCKKNIVIKILTFFLTFLALSFSLRRGTSVTINYHFHFSIIGYFNFSRISFFRRDEAKPRRLFSQLVQQAKRSSILREEQPGLTQMVFLQE